MDKHGEHSVFFTVFAPILAGPYRALNYRVNNLQMRRVKRQGHMQYAAGRFNIGRKSLVVLHIAGIHLTCAAGGFTFEFTEQFLGRFPQYIDQHIEPAPMGHSDDNLFDSNSTGPLDQIAEHWHQSLSTFQ